MAYLKISNMDYTLELSRISGYDLSCFSLKNQYTGEAGNTIVYPVRMQKKRISVTAEIYADEYHIFENIMKSPEIHCVFRNPDGEKSGYFNVSSDMTIVKIVPETSGNPALYAASFTIEEV